MPPAERCEPLQAVAGEEQQGCVATVCCSTDSVVQQGTAEKSASTWKKKKRIKLINASCACGEIQSVPPVLGKLFVSSLELLNEFPYIICQGSAGELAAALSSLLVTWDYCQIISRSVDGSVRALQMMARLEDALSEPWFLLG